MGCSGNGTELILLDQSMPYIRFKGCVDFLFDGFAQNVQ